MRVNLKKLDEQVLANARQQEHSKNMADFEAGNTMVNPNLSSEENSAAMLNASEMHSQIGDMINQSKPRSWSEALSDASRLDFTGRDNNEIAPLFTSVGDSTTAGDVLGSFGRGVVRAGATGVVALGSVADRVLSGNNSSSFDGGAKAMVDSVNSAYTNHGQNIALENDKEKRNAHLEYEYGDSAVGKAMQTVNSAYNTIAATVSNPTALAAVTGELGLQAGVFAMGGGVALTAGYANEQYKESLVKFKEENGRDPNREESALMMGVSATHMAANYVGGKYLLSGLKSIPKGGLAGAGKSAATIGVNAGIEGVTEGYQTHIENNLGHLSGGYDPISVGDAAGVGFVGSASVSASGGTLAASLSSVATAAKVSKFALDKGKGALVAGSLDQNLDANGAKYNPVRAAANSVKSNDIDGMADSLDTSFGDMHKYTATAQEAADAGEMLQKNEALIAGFKQYAVDIQASLQDISSPEALAEQQDNLKSVEEALAMAVAESARLKPIAESFDAAGYKKAHNTNEQVISKVAKKTTVDGSKVNVDSILEAPPEVRDAGLRSMLASVGTHSDASIQKVLTNPNVPVFFKTALRSLSEAIRVNTMTKGMKGVSTDIFNGSPRGIDGTKQFLGINDYITEIPALLAVGAEGNAQHRLEGLRRFEASHSSKAKVLSEAFEMYKKTAQEVHIAPNKEGIWGVVKDATVDDIYKAGGTVVKANSIKLTKNVALEARAIKNTLTAMEAIVDNYEAAPRSTLTAAERNLAKEVKDEGFGEEVKTAEDLAKARLERAKAETAKAEASDDVTPEIKKTAEKIEAEAKRDAQIMSEFSSKPAKGKATKPEVVEKPKLVEVEAKPVDKKEPIETDEDTNDDKAPYDLGIDTGSWEDDNDNGGNDYYSYNPFNDEGEPQNNNSNTSDGFNYDDRFESEQGKVIVGQPQMTKIFNESKASFHIGSNPFTSVMFDTSRTMEDMHKDDVVYIGLANNETIESVTPLIEQAVYLGLPIILTQIKTTKNAKNLTAALKELVINLGYTLKARTAEVTTGHYSPKVEAKVKEAKVTLPIENILETEAKIAVLQVTKEEAEAEGQVPIKFRNRVVAGFKQSVNGLLTKVAGLRNGLLTREAIELYLDEDITEAEAAILNDFTDFEESFVETLDAMDFKDDITYELSDLFRHLKDNGELDDNVKTAMALAAVEYLNGINNSPYITMDDFKGLWGYSDNDVVPYKFYKRYNTFNNAAPTVFSDVGEHAMRLLSIKATGKALVGDSQRLATSLGMAIVTTLMKMNEGNLIEVKTIKVSDLISDMDFFNGGNSAPFNYITQSLNTSSHEAAIALKAFNDNPSEDSLRGLQAYATEIDKLNATKRYIVKRFNEEGIQPAELEYFNNALGKSTTFLEKLFKGEASNKRYPTLEKPKKLDKSINKTKGVIPSPVAKELAKSQEHPWSLRDGVFNRFKDLYESSPEVLKQLLGIGTEADLMKLHISQRDSQQSAWDNTWNSLAAVMDWVSESGLKPNQDFYLPENGYSNHRLGYKSNVINPQANIIQRVLARRSAWETTVDLNEPLVIDGLPSKLGRYLKGIAEGMEKIPLNITEGSYGNTAVDKVKGEDFLPAFIEYINKPYVSKAAKDFFNGDMSDMVNIQAVLEEFGTDHLSVGSLFELGNYLQAKEDDAQTLVVDSIQSSDGISNGVALAKISQGYLPEVEGNSMGFHTTAGKTSLDVLKEGTPDVYATLGEASKLHESNLQSPELVSARATFKVIDKGFGDRKGGKAILTPVIYSSGRRATVNTQHNIMNENIPKLFIKVSKGEMEVEELNNHLNGLIELYGSVSNVSFNVKQTIPEILGSLNKVFPFIALKHVDEQGLDAATFLKPMRETLREAGLKGKDVSVEAVYRWLALSLGMKVKDVMVVVESYPKERVKAELVKLLNYSLPPKMSKLTKVDFEKEGILEQELDASQIAAINFIAVSTRGMASLAAITYGAEAERGTASRALFLKGFQSILTITDKLKLAAESKFRKTNEAITENGTTLLTITEKEMKEFQDSIEDMQPRIAAPASTFAGVRDRLDGAIALNSIKRRYTNSAEYRTTTTIEGEKWTGGAKTMQSFSKATSGASKLTQALDGLVASKISGGFATLNTHDSASVSLDDYVPMVKQQNKTVFESLYKSSLHVAIVDGILDAVKALDKHKEEFGEDSNYADAFAEVFSLIKVNPSTYESYFDTLRENMVDKHRTLRTIKTVSQYGGEGGEFHVTPEVTAQMEKYIAKEIKDFEYKVEVLSNLNHEAGSIIREMNSERKRAEELGDLKPITLKTTHLKTILNKLGISIEDGLGERVAENYKEDERLDKATNAMAYLIEYKIQEMHEKGMTKEQQLAIKALKANTRTVVSQLTHVNKLSGYTFPQQVSMIINDVAIRKEVRKMSLERMVIVVNQIKDFVLVHVLGMPAKSDYTALDAFQTSFEVVMDLQDITESLSDNTGNPLYFNGSDFSPYTANGVIMDVLFSGTKEHNLQDVIEKVSSTLVVSGEGDTLANMEQANYYSALLQYFSNVLGSDAKLYYIENINDIKNLPKKAKEHIQKKISKAEVPNRPRHIPSFAKGKDVYIIADASLATTQAVALEELLHEMYHTATAWAINNPDKLKGTQKEGYEELKAAYDYIKSQIYTPLESDSSGVKLDEKITDSLDITYIDYAFTDLHEFLAVLTTSTSAMKAVASLVNPNGQLVSDVVYENLAKVLKLPEGTPGINVIQGIMSAAKKLSSKPDETFDLGIYSAPREIDSRRENVYSSPLTTFKELVDKPTEHTNSIVTVMEDWVAPLVTQLTDTEWNENDSATSKFSEGIEGFELSQAEEYAGSLIEAIAQEVFKTTSGTLAYRDLFKLYESVQSNTTPANFLDGKWLNATQEERDIATRKYDSIFRSTSPNYLSSFLALSIVSEDFKGFVDKVTPKRNREGSKTINALNGAIEMIYDTASGSRKVNLTSSNLKIIASKLGKIQQREKFAKDSKIDNSMDAVTNFLSLDKFSDKARTLIRKISEKTPFRPYVTIATSTELNNLPLAIKERLDDLNPNAYLNSMRSVLNEVAADTSSVHRVHVVMAAANHFEGARRQRAEKAAEVMASGFDKNAKKVKAKVRSGITNLLMRTDLQALTDYSLKEIASYIKRPSSLTAEIELRSKRYNEYQLRQSQKLAEMMVTGNVATGTLTNPLLILRGWGTANPDTSNLEMNHAEVADLDSLISLMALEKELKRADTETLDFINDNPKALASVITTHRGFAKESLDAVFKEGSYNYVKGYLPELLDNTRNMVAVPVSEMVDYEAKGYEKVFNIVQSKIDNTEPKVMMFIRDGGASRYISGAMSLSDTKRKGQGLEINDEDFPALLAKYNKAMAMEMRTGIIEPNGLSPTFDNSGKIIALRYMASHAVKQNYLKRDNDPFNIIGRLASSNMDKLNTTALNNGVLDMIEGDLKANYHLKPNAYIEVGASANNKRGREIFASMPWETRKNFLERFPNGVTKVNNEIILATFGYTHPSLTHSFAKTREEKSALEHYATTFFTAMFDGKAELRVGQLEHLINDMVKLWKDYIVIRSLSTAVINLKSNFVYLLGSGVPPAFIAKEGKNTLQQTLTYRKDSDRLAKARIELLRKDNEDKKLESEIARLEDSLKRNPLNELMKLTGFTTSIVSDQTLLDDKNSYSSESFQKISEMRSSPNALNSVLDFVSVAPNTTIHKLISAATSESDFVAKVLKYKWEMKKGATTAQAISEANYLFIDYNMPLQPEFQYLESMGVLPFTKYAIRIQKAVLNTLSGGKSGNLATEIVLGKVMGLGTIMDEALYSQRFPIGFVPLRLPGTLGDTIVTESIGDAFDFIF